MTCSWPSAALGNGETIVVSRHVLENASSRSLILIDELGKGTEASAGAALCAAQLEELESRASLGIFATCAGTSPGCARILLARSWAKYHPATLSSLTMVLCNSSAACHAGM